MKKQSLFARDSIYMLIAAIVIFSLRWTLPLLGGYSELATRMLIFSILVLGFDILVGLTGYLSFGHAAFWGIGAYICGYILLHFTQNILVAMILGVLIVSIIAFLLGIITLRRHGIYFAILTLAFAEMFYYLALAPLQKWTGGDNGLTGIKTPQLFGLELSGLAMYIFVGIWTLIALYTARRIKNSPYGLMLRAIKSNEERLTFTGINVFRYKVMAFLISGIFAGLAGTLFAAYETYVPTESLHWTLSGEIVIMSVIGGFGTLIGPMMGAAIVLYLENVLSAITDQWNLILGVIFMSFVIFLPGGVMSLSKQLRRLFSRDQVPANRTESQGGD
ncbi:MAG: branched-chain amino acid ABC transporter permease [Trueperaceae bacterium]|nr:branched-chain amino acid ABC transporter permease [Trueperaceae bacterium]